MAPIKDSVHDWPLWWFASLERAVEVGNFADAAKAQRELERLGVKVQYSGLRPAHEREWGSVGT